MSRNPGLTSACTCTDDDGTRAYGPAYGHLAECEIGRVYRPDGTRYAIKPGAYRVTARDFRTREGRAWFRATLANIRASNARIARATTPRTMAELSPVIAAREAAIRKWANGTRGVALAGTSDTFGTFRYFAGVNVAVGADWRDVPRIVSPVRLGECVVAAELHAMASRYLASGLRS